MKANPEILSNEATNEANQFLTIAKFYNIDSSVMAEAAADDLSEIKAKMKALDETRFSITRPMDEAKQKVMELFNKPKNVLLEAETLLKNSLTVWNKKENLRLENERKAAEEAQRKATEEARKAADEAKRLADELAAANVSPEIVLEATQDAELAAQTAESIQYLAPVAQAKTHLKGISTSEKWKAEVVDLMALVKAIAAGEASIELIEPAQTEINKRATALKKEFIVPGIISP